MIIKYATLALRFLLELCALAALSYWGFTSGQSVLVKIGLGLGAPLLAALVWGTFVAPRATVRVPKPVRLLIELLVFGLAVAGLAAANHPALAWAFGLAIVLDDVLLAVWKL